MLLKPLLPDLLRKAVRAVHARDPQLLHRHTIVILVVEEQHVLERNAGPLVDGPEVRLFASCKAQHVGAAIATNLAWRPARSHGTRAHRKKRGVWGGGG